MTRVHKYWTLFQLSWQSGLVYRTSLIIWRLRQLLLTLMSLTLWSVVFATRTQAFAYTQAQMTSYIFLVSILQSVIMASSLNGLAGEIYSGHISQYFLKPQRIFWTFAAAEAADKLRNLFFSLAEGVLLYWIFAPELVIPHPLIALTFIIWTALGVLIYFFISIIFGTLGFWSPDTWGPKFLFFMILDFTAGKLYPLDILPVPVQTILKLTPFPYLSYVQIQLFLGRLPTQDIWLYWAGLLTWTVICWQLATRLWNKGAHSYEATGQ